MDKNLLHVWYMNSLAGYSVATYIIGIDQKVLKMMLVVYISPVKPIWFP